MPRSFEPTPDAQPRTRRLSSTARPPVQFQASGRAVSSRQSGHHFSRFGAPRCALAALDDQVEVYKSGAPVAICELRVGLTRREVWVLDQLLELEDSECPWSARMTERLLFGPVNGAS